MRTTGTWRHRGTSTILGTLIFIGILFSAVIPTYLVMKQADTFLEMSKFELERLDEERSTENIHFYVYPTSDSLSMIVRNNGDLLVRIVRIWINDNLTDTSPPSSVQPMSDINLGPYPVSLQPGPYYITLTTDRGNVFASDSVLHYDEMEGWKAEVLSIKVLVASSQGTMFRVDIEGPTCNYTDMVEKYVPKYFIVETPGIYTVKILRGWNVIHEEVVEISWPYGPPVAWVFA